MVYRNKVKTNTPTPFTSANNKNVFTSKLALLFRFRFPKRVCDETDPFLLQRKCCGQQTKYTKLYSIIEEKTRSKDKPKPKILQVDNFNKAYNRIRFLGRKNVPFGLTTDFSRSPVFQIAIARIYGKRDGIPCSSRWCDWTRIPMDFECPRGVRSESVIFWSSIQTIHLPLGFLQNHFRLHHWTHHNRSRHLLLFCLHFQLSMAPVQVHTFTL